MWRTPQSLPHAAPIDALLQCAPTLSLLELVVAIDHLILPGRYHRGSRPILEKEEIVDRAAQSSGRGMRRLRAALEVARVGAESRMESELDFELARLGLDRLYLQQEIHDADGAFIGRFDEVDPFAKKIIEYDGEQHRKDRAQ